MKCLKVLHDRTTSSSSGSSCMTFSGDRSSDLEVAGADLDQHFSLCDGRVHSEIVREVVRHITFILKDIEAIEDWASSSELFYRL